MHTMAALRRIRELELALGHSHRCLLCSEEFLAHEDGCPYCGAGAPTVSLHLFPEGESTEGVAYWIFTDPRTGGLLYPQGSFCYWPYYGKEREIILVGGL